MTETAFEAAIPARFRRKRRRGRQLPPPRMTRFEDRHAMRIIQFLDLVTEIVTEQLDPHLEGIVQEQAQDEITHHAIRVIAPIFEDPDVNATSHGDATLILDDAAERIARVFRKVTVFVEQTIPDPRVRQQAERSGNEINDANEDFNDGNIKSVLGVSVFPQEPWLSTEMDHFIHENASLIQGLAAEQIRDVEQSVFRNVRAGASTAKIQADILEIVQGNRRRARLIARDQTNKFNGRLSQLRQAALGVVEYHWRTSQDERVRSEHRLLDGTIQEWANAPVTVRSGKRAGETNHPGQDIQCIPADSSVALADGAKKLFRRAYIGKLTTLVADDGTTLSATPNHPILTGSGWKRIGSVDPGEDIFKATGQRGHVREYDVDQSILLIGDVFDAALKVFPPPMRQPGIRGQFHGDGTDEEVDIIDTDCRLPGEPDTTQSHLGCKEILAGADQHIPEIFFGALGPPEFSLLGLWPATDGIVRGARKLFSLFTSQLTHADEHRAAAASWLNPLLQKAVADESAAHSVFFRDSLLAFPGKIVDDNQFGIHILSIVRAVALAGGGNDIPSAELLGECVCMATDIRRGAFEAGAIAHQPFRVVERFDLDHNGPVFNVETSCGWYAADDYIMKNCRCIAEPIFPDEL